MSSCLDSDDAPVGSAELLITTAPVSHAVTLVLNDTRLDSDDAPVGSAELETIHALVFTAVTLVFNADRLDSVAAPVGSAELETTHAPVSHAVTLVLKASTAESSSVFLLKIDWLDASSVSILGVLIYFTKNIKKSKCCNTTCEQVVVDGHGDVVSSPQKSVDYIAKALETFPQQSTVI